ncbi:ABC transporter permease [Malacoplasma iowae]|uniref:ABC transporter permease n=1 Tax=Malacoplasma iowae TaxID=2116 RepID=UPI00022C6481|nr:ABC transporter permease [Malacoplasma iowae]EGZ31766.1 putative integral membrane protein [Malacoplasma iowae 695]
MVRKKQRRETSIKPLFIFSLSLIGKKVIVLCGLLAYAIIICLYTSIIPILSEKPPISLFRSSYSTSLLMLLVAAVISIIAVEIFRTPIDDGTELLIVSKPISRKEIVFVKLFIFLLYILLLSLIGTIIASFAFLNSSSSKDDSTTLVLGVLLGTIVNGLLFGSITTILSIYLKKIVSMVISVGISFALLIMTFLGSFTIKSPVAILKDRGYTVTPITILDISKDKKNNDDVLKQTNALFSTGLPDGETLQMAWNKAANVSPYKTFSFFDFGYQLSSLYSLSNPSPDVRSVIGQMSSTSIPIDIEFDESYNILNNPLLTKIKIYNSDLTPKPANDNNQTPEKEIASINLIPLIYDYASINFDKESKDILKLKFSKDFISKHTESYFLNKWEEAWKKYGKTNSSTDSKYVSNDSFLGEKDTLNFLNMYFKEPQNNLNTSNIKNVLTDLCEIQLGGLIKLASQKDLSIQKILNSNEFKTVLALSEIKIEKKKQDSNTYQKETITKPDIEDYISIKNISTKFQYNGNIYRIDLLCNYGNANSFKNFIKVTTKSLINKNYVIPVWTALSFMVFISAAILYTRRDFA